MISTDSTDFKISEHCERIKKEYYLPFEYWRFCYSNMDCYVCGTSFGQRKDCYKHLRNIHGVELNLKRKRNDEETVEAFNFDRDVERNVFKCRHCSRSFLNHTERDRHEKTHSRPKPYGCKQCGIFQQ